jgi:hypothetical protein
MMQQKKIQALKNILVAESRINAWGDLEESIKLEEFRYKNTIKNQTRINSCLSNVQSNPASFTELVEEFCNGASSAIKLHWDCWRILQNGAPASKLHWADC